MTPPTTRPHRIVGSDLDADSLRNTPRLLPNAVVP